MTVSDYIDEIRGDIIDLNYLTNGITNLEEVQNYPLAIESKEDLETVMANKIYYLEEKLQNISKILGLYWEDDRYFKK